MQRRTVAPRPGWQRIVEEQGIIWHTGDDGQPYWDESGCYVFTLAEIEQLEAATEAVYDLFLKAGDRIVKDAALLSSLGIPDFCHAAIRAEWRSDRPALDYGRFDFGWDGTDEPKLFEFNADTPTAMLEAGAIQWEWKEQCFPQADQFTSLHDRLVERWRYMAPELPGGRVWFAHADDASGEDTLTTTYMRDLAEQAGLETRGLLIDEIGLDAAGRIVDGQDHLITSVFKLYPWEWIVAEEFGPAIVRNLPTTLWIEPIWKMLWSNKAVLALLHDMFPRHPNLLPASLEPGKVGPSYAVKPILAREGANIEVVREGEVLARSAGGYQTVPRVYQQLYPLRDFGGGYPVLGLWIVGGEAAGLGIREDGLITGNRARFVPHIIEG
jgi:glutathionylspermidine synthase